MMKLTVGMGALESYPRLAKAGADELFLGYVPMEYLERYGNTVPLNRREVLNCNLQIDSLQDMRILSAMRADYGVPLSVAFNAHFYRPEQPAWIADRIGELMAIGFDRFIVADPALMVELTARGIKPCLHLSGEAGAISPSAMRFFGDLGITRFIFPRKISPEEMAHCIADLPGAEYEAFALNELCHYSGGYCSSLHLDGMEPLCRVEWRLADRNELLPAQARPALDESAPGASGCGLCALKRLSRAGITHLKIVGRGGHIDQIERDVRLMRRALLLAEDCTEAEYPQRLKHELLNDACGGNCYYP